MKRFIAVTLSVLTILSSTAFAADSTRFVYNGKEVSIAATAIFKDGYTYLPAKQVFEAAGMRVIEKSSNNSLTAEAKGKPGYVSVWIGKTSGRMNGTNIQLGKAPFVENGATYVSSKFIEEQLGVKVSYDSSKNTIYINSVGEGKITSTVGKYTTTAKTSTSAGSTSGSGSTTSASTSSYKVYSGFKYIPDFASVTGVKAPINGDGLGSIIGNNVYTSIIKGNSIAGIKYEYYDVDANDFNAYISALKNAGFTVNGSGTSYSFEKNGEKGSIGADTSMFTGNFIRIMAYYK